MTDVLVDQKVREPRDAIEQGYATKPPIPEGGGGGGAGGGARRASTAKRLATGLLFIGPNIVGFLAFTLLPLLFAMVLAFTDWDLKLHNQFKVREGTGAALQFVGIDNFLELLFEPTLPGERGMFFGLIDGWTWDPGFWKFLGNTLFFMMAMPFGIGLSLLGAVLLSKDLTGGTPTNRRRTLVFGGSVVGVMLLVGGTLTVMQSGSPMNGMVLLLCAVASVILLGGVVGGQAVYRTIFYLPHFVSGVATFILWKKIFNRESGPLTAALQPVLDTLASAVNAVPAWLVGGLMFVLLAAAAGLLLWAFNKLATDYRDGEVGARALWIPTALLLLPAALTVGWYGVFEPAAAMTPRLAAVGMLIVAGLGLVWLLRGVFDGQELPSHATEGGGSSMMFGAVFMVAQMILIGLAAVLFHLPGMAADGLRSPDWLGHVNWAKPSIMFMGLWAAIGGNTMLLYLAALTNVPQELYEAADIDGAGRFTKFWNVTWPQLAPTTFFVVVMGVIGGLQGGFEMARVMTQGGPAQQTTTLSYFIFQSGFETGRFAFASAVSWVMFFLVFSITLFNWKFGNRYVND